MNYVKREVSYTREGTFAYTASTYCQAYPNSSLKTFYTHVLIHDTEVRQSVSTLEWVKRLFLSRVA